MISSLLPIIVACGARSSATDQFHAPDSISPSDDPSRVLPNVDAILADNIGPDDVGQTFGVADNNIPYPDTYWPFVQEGVDAHWSSGSSALEKYMSIVAPDSTQAAKDWEHNNHGSAVPGVADWWGHCPGWTGAAMSNPPILHGVDAKSDGQGGITACTPDDTGCVHFEIGDINALEAEIYVDGNSSFGGARCDTKPSDIKRDEAGRIIRDGTGCKGINAGSLVVILGNRMKANNQAFAIDAQNDFNTDQIWNQPAYRYTVNAYDTLSESEAANMVAHGERTGDLVRYKWNTRAQGFALVDISISWVSEHGPNTNVVSGLDSTRQTRFRAVIELDGDPASGSTSIIGGEYLDDPTTGADRLTVPPFVWVSNGPGPEDLSTSVGGNNHNPYVRPSLVQQLIALGTT